MATTVKICMILQNLFPPIDVRPYKEAKTLIRHGHKVTLFCIKGDGQKEEEDFEGIHIKRIVMIPLPHFTFLNFALSVTLKMQEKKKFDVFHIHNPPDSLVLPALAGKLWNKKKVILDIHDPVISGMLQDPGKYKRRTFYVARFWEWMALRASHKIIIVSESLKERLLSMRVPAGKITVIENYVDLDTFDPDKAHPSGIREKYGLEGKRIVLYGGTISPIRGIDVLISTVARLKTQYQDIMLVIVGNKDQYCEELMKLAADEGIEQNLVMLPWQPYESMPDFIAAADICVLPRKYSYHTASGSPNTLFQYMAMGKPIVGTDLASINSFIDDSCAVLVEPGSVASMTEGLRKVLDNPELAKRMGQNAYRLAVEKYNWGREEQKLLQLYSEMSSSK